MVASILSIEPLVVVSLVPRPHLYLSGYEANLITHLNQLPEEEIQLVWKLNCEMLHLLNTSEKPTKR